MLRSRRERAIQTVWFELIGLAIVCPLYALVAGVPAGESLAVLVALSVAVMAWSALYNSAFDSVERRLTGRVASDRPQRLRIVHAVGLEATAVLVSWPLIVALTPLSWLQALVADLALSLAYAAYGYLFHLGFDRLRPVRAAPSRSEAQESMQTMWDALAPTTAVGTIARSKVTKRPPWRSASASR